MSPPPTDPPEDRLLLGAKFAVQNSLSCRQVPGISYPKSELNLAARLWIQAISRRRRAISILADTPDAGGNCHLPHGGRLCLRKSLQLREAPAPPQSWIFPRQQARQIRPRNRPT